MLESMRQLYEEIRLLKEYTDIETDELEKTADAIEREVEERYIELPKDADGKPIRAGDKLINDHTEQVITVTQVAMSRDGWYVHTDHGILGLLEHLHHYEPPTVEDVLREFALEIDPYVNVSGANIIAEYAKRLQLREE